MQAVAISLRHKGKSIGLVPTMGALHEGHLSLVERACAENDSVIVSIFVNPAQFGPHEDYLKYPRPFAKDAALCRKAGVSYLFAPSVQEMYPQGYRTYVAVEWMSEVLCGKFRPGHFRGVATVVTKLFLINQPSNAYFGAKDYQQLQILRRMAADLNIPVKIVPCPIIREASGLARSSRNQYLSPNERDAASALSRALFQARERLRSGKKSAAVLKETMNSIRTIPGARIDYLELIHPDTLEPLRKARLPAVMATAVWVGKTRLIDNVFIEDRGAGRNNDSH